jgi:hypothetical protein
MGSLPLPENSQQSGRKLPPEQYRFKKGVSGNPGGRPKKISNALDTAINKEVAAQIARGVIKTAKRGNVLAFVAIRETIEGKLPQALTGGDGGPLQIEVVYVGGKK